LRILQVISHYVPAYAFGGPLRVAHGLSRALVANGHGVTVCTTNLADADSDLDVRLGEPVEVDGAKVFYEPVRQLRRWGFSPGLRARVRRELRSTDVALIHAHYQYANYVGARSARKAGVPYVVFAHNSLRKQGMEFKSPRLKKTYLRLLENSNLQGAMFLAFNAPEELDGSLFKKKGVVVPNGIDPADFQPRPREGLLKMLYPSLCGKVVFLFLGRLDFKQKGLDLLLQAFAKVSQSHSQMHLVLAGPDESGGRDLILQWADQLEIQNRITLTGILTGEKKIAALQDSDAFVLPSRYEGSSIALLEAMYFGLPVLTTDRVGLSQEIEARGIGIVARPEIEQLTVGLRSLADPATRRGFSGRGTRLILENHVWSGVAEKLVSTISSSAAFS
jgi:glycosyltransferase involved in cell wall biosynthesis